MVVQPYIIGRGMAGQAMARALAVLPVTRPEWEIRAPRWVPRGEVPRPENPAQALLCIANPHALHAQTLLAAEAAGFRRIVCEKPVCVNLDQARELEAVRAFVAVCHGYRMMWGPRRIREALKGGEFGELITLEARYWQSSATKPRKAGWKDDPKLNGPMDTMVDLGAHWVDMVQFLLGETPKAGRGWLSHANSAGHRDTHGHLQLDFSPCRTFASVSKTFHGFGNNFEFRVLGTKKAARWNFEDPDTLEWAEQGITRRELKEEWSPAGLPPQHSLGWLEGYVALFRELFEAEAERRTPQVPNLQEGLAVVRTLHTVDWAD